MCDVREREEDLLISWESNIDNSSMLAEGLTNHVLVSTEGKVTKEEGIGRRVLGVAEGLSTVVGAFTRSVVVTRGGEVDVGLTTIDQRSLLGLESSGGIDGVAEIDVTETLGASSGLVGDDTSTSDLSELLELTVEPLVINVPAQVTNEQVCGSIGRGSSLGLDLLCGSFGLILSLALLGRNFSLVIIAGIVGIFLIIVAASRRVGAVLTIIGVLL
jgi:hypothetical protein